jgi:hypothetical protein
MLSNFKLNLLFGVGMNKMEGSDKISPEKTYLYLFHCQKCGLVEEGNYLSGNSDILIKTFRTHENNSSRVIRCLDKGMYHENSIVMGKFLYYFMWE